MTYAEIKDLKPTAFKRFCGVKPHTFARMVKVLEQREQRKKKKGRDPGLMLEDQLLLTLQYWREYRTYFHLSVSWGIAEATVCRTIHRVENALIQAREFHLPGKKKLRESDCQFEVVVVDVSETPVERPKKSSAAVSAGRSADIRSKRNS